MSGTVKLNLGQFTAMRRDARTLGAINAEADRLAARANSMGADTHAGTPVYEAVRAIPSRVGSVALVSTANTAARVDNAVRNTLAKALGTGGG